jgi:hypothetical protein
MGLENSDSDAFGGTFAITTRNLNSVLEVFEPNDRDAKNSGSTFQRVSKQRWAEKFRTTQRFRLCTCFANGDGYTYLCPDTVKEDDYISRDFSLICDMAIITQETRKLLAEHSQCLSFSTIHHT